MTMSASSQPPPAAPPPHPQQQQHHPPDSELPPHTDDPEVESRRVLRALRAVYVGAGTGGGACGGTGGDGESSLDRRDVADRYLTSFQRAPAAWVVCDRLLSANDVPPPAAAAARPAPAAGGGGGGEDSALLRTQRHFFAAQTLHAKCLCDVHQLPSASLPSLRDSLLNHLVRHASEALVRAPAEDRPANRPLVTRLCMAVGALAAQMHWTSCLEDVANGILGPRPELGPAVLELFRSVPEEADSNRLVLPSEEELWAYRDVLRGSYPVVLGLCEHAVRSIAANAAEGDGISSFRDVATAEAVLSCLQSWVRVVDGDPRLWENTPLLPWTFDLLGDPNNGGFELAVDVCVELLRAFPSDRRGSEGLVRTIIPRVMALGRSDDNDTASPFRKAVQEEDEDGIRGYVRIFTEMAESYLSLILSHEEMGQSALVELVLECATAPDPDVAGITLNFWYRFVTGLEELEPFEYRQIKIDSFAPQLMRLLEICARLLRYPPGAEDLSLDRLDDVEVVRGYFADTVEDCCRLLGGEAVLRALGDPLREECGRVAGLPPARQAGEWHGIEAYMYAVQAISLYVPSDERQIVPFVMGLIPQLPGDVPLLRATACAVVGKYASWLALQPSHLGPVLPYLAQGLSVPRCAGASAVAIREVCERCGDQLGDSALRLWDDIVAARERHEGGGGGGEEFVLDVKNELAVLEGVCRAASSKALADPSVIQRLANPIVNGLKTLAAPQGHVPGPKRIAAEVCRLTVLVQHLRLPRSAPGSAPAPGGMDRSEFILALLRETWPSLDALSLAHPRDFNCGEKLCRLHKHALRECGASRYAPLLEPLVEQTVRNFAASLGSPYLYLASVIVGEYGNDPSRAALLYDTVARMSRAAFDTLRTLDDLADHPDVVEELFFLAGKTVSRCPSLMVQSDLLRSLLRCAALGMRLHHRDANRGTLNFLESAVSYGLKLRSHGGGGGAAEGDSQQNMAALEQAILAEGEPLVINLAQALLGDLPAYRLDARSGSVAGVLFGMNRLCPELLVRWIEPPLVAAPEHARAAFLVTLRGMGTSSRDEFNASVRRFTAVCERSRKRKI